ncbi:glycosyltransferase family 2 protein [Microbacterium sp. ARD31]|uniref:glycosyltransferase family 2 protein n=1 Tax=Microbacterium sp. ARD31 TaxID=2962576 RepID=UPI002880ECB8|nr:glycosyltransferase family 2 protein [Microbacterium sp. ARD31]MDT0182755.1 glycosyltransferase family 2 protein [Microbacterium sp. ARD31]
MRRWLSRGPLIGVVVPVYGVERYLDECLRSLVAQQHRRWEAVLVDDGSTDRSGEIAEAWARRDHRISVVHQANAGLGAARNAGLAHVRGDYLAFLDSDDLLQPSAFSTLVASLEESGSDFATGSILQWRSEDDSAVDDPFREPPWMRRLHHPPAQGLRVEDRPEILGDVFAWNKLFRRSWWDAAGLAWPEGVRYEDQPTTTRAFLDGRFDVLAETTYVWRIREGSITQTRATVQDLADRWETKRMALAAVRAHGDAEVERVFVDRVLAGDLWRYFLLVPGCTPEWWRLLRSGVLEIWGTRLVESGLPPVHRLAGWLVAEDRRADVTALMEWVGGLDGPAPRAQDIGTGAWRLSIPPSVLDETTVAPEALRLRDHEV